MVILSLAIESYLHRNFQGQNRRADEESVGASSKTEDRACFARQPQHTEKGKSCVPLGSYRGNRQY